MKMASIQTGIEVNGQFTGAIYNIINEVNLVVSAMYDMQESMSADIDTSGIETARNEISQTTAALDAMNEALNSQPAPVEIPVRWQSESLEVFTSTGLDRFRQEVQSADAMLQQLCSTQDAIARQAYNANIFPPEAFQNLNTMAVRIDNIRDRIRQIESNPLNMGTDTANAELERLRLQLNTAVQRQNDLSEAMRNIDVSAANTAYLRLNQTISATERYIRDGVNEQGQFNREIAQGTDKAGHLRSMISQVVKDYTGLAGIKKVISWIEECTEAFDTQRNAELQLMAVLANTLDPDSVSKVTADTSEAVAEINGIQDQIDSVAVSADTQALTAAFNTITGKASEIQSKGIYRDEVMIAGAVEFSTYFSDTAAIEMMMDTLADYAMGMSGGGELDSGAMAQYAEGLGKIMSGSYDAMTQKGFAFSEAQKAIIEGTATQEQIIAAIGEEYLDASQEVQAAAAINAVIAESWGGLYESMSNTPEGKIIQMTNAWGEMKEVVGSQLYPYVILFVDAITGHWGAIQTVLGGFTLGLQFIMGILSWLLGGALDFVQAVVDNWSWISPIIYGIVAALAVYGAYLAITEGLEFASAATAGAVAVGKGLLAAATMIATGATWAETTAQMGLNSAMYACPVVWIIILIIALVAALVVLCSWIAKATGAANSGIGIIMGSLQVADAFVRNLFVALINIVIDIVAVLWNYIADFANYFANVFTDPTGAVARLFFDMVDCVLGLLQTLASAIDTLFGSSLAGSVQGWRDDLEEWVDNTFGQGKEIVTKINGEDWHISRVEYGEAWDAGVRRGDKIAEAIDNFSLSDLFGSTNEFDPEDYGPNLKDLTDDSGINDELDGISENTGAIRDSLDITQEELKYMRDIAEQEAVNRFTTAEISIDMSGMQNTVNSGDDLDGFISRLTNSVNEAVDSMAEGVHE